MNIKLIFFILLICSTVGAQESAEEPEEQLEESDFELAEQAENSLADLLRFNFQYFSYFPVGDDKDTANTLRLRAILPFDLSSEFLLVNRTTIPYIWEPLSQEPYGEIDGLSNIEMDFFLGPRGTEGSQWGLGPAILLPTSTNDQISPANWALGPLFAFYETAGEWVYGFLVKQLWSLGNSKISHLVFNYTFNFNFLDGTYLTSSPYINCNWKETDGDSCTIPFGGGVGKVVKINHFPIDFSLQGFYNVTSILPDARWTILAQIQLLFPK